MNFKTIKPEILQEKIESLSYHYTFEHLVEFYLRTQHELIYERAMGIWLDALANAYRDDDEQSWDEEKNAREELKEIKKELKSKYND